MMRSSLLFVTLLGVLGASGCSSLECGAGTKQVQQKDGSLRCLPVDAPASSIACDADMGAVIVGGVCVSAITCGPNTMLDPTTNSCIATAGPTRGQAPACSSPASGTICVDGTVRHLLDNSFLAVGETVRVTLYEPLPFLTAPAGMPPAPLNDKDGNPAQMDTDDGFVFNNVNTPGSGLIAIAVSSSPNGASTHALTGTGGQVISGQSYQIDGFLTELATVATWSSQSNGIDYAASGAFVARFFADPVPSPNKLVWTDSMPVAGVSILKGGVQPPEARFFSTSLGTIDPSLTVTSAVGGAIVPKLGLVSNYTGMGGTFGGNPIMWNTEPGGTAPGVVFVGKFNRCLNSTCQ